jgi:hypothetical protein
MSTNVSGGDLAKRRRDPAESLARMNEFLKLSLAVDSKKATTEAIHAFRDYLDAHPAMLWNIGDLGRLAERKMLDRMSTGKSDREVIGAQVERLRRDLGDDGAPAVERLLIQDVVNSYVQLAFARIAQENALSGEGGVSLECGMYWERKLSATHRRFTRSVETLARVRKLALPDLRINATVTVSAEPVAEQRPVSQRTRRPHAVA